MHSRTSRAVPSETPASLVISRSDAVGQAAMNRAARRRPSLPLTGRRFPSRPTRVFNCGTFSVERCFLTVFALKPTSAAMVRSDQSGCQLTSAALPPCAQLVTAVYRAACLP